MNTYQAVSKSGNITRKNSKRVYTFAVVGSFSHADSKSVVADEVLTWHGDEANAVKSANVLRGRGFTSLYTVPVQAI